MSKSVTESEWRQKAEGLAEWRKNRTSPPNLDLYRKIVSMVHVGETVADIGSGQCHLKKCLPDSVKYIGIDPFPLSDNVFKADAEEFQLWETLPDGKIKKMKAESIFMLSALDNVRDVYKSLFNIKQRASENIVILTSIGVPPDKNHTVQVDREDLVAPSFRQWA